MWFSKELPVHRWAPEIVRLPEKVNQVESSNNDEQSLTTSPVSSSLKQEIKDLKTLIFHGFQNLNISLPFRNETNQMSSLTFCFPFKMETNKISRMILAKP